MSTAHITKAKRLAETVNNSSTLQDDDDLAWAVESNENYILAGCLVLSAMDATADIKLALTLPSGASMVLQAGIATAEWGTSAGGWEGESETTSGTGIALDIISATLPGIVQFRASIAVGATRGTVQLQWAQNSAQANDLTVRAGSFGILTKV